MNYCPACHADRKLLLCSGYFECLECHERFNVDGTPKVYNESTILRGSEVVFTPAERTGVIKFHRSRIAFAQYKGQLLTNVYDEREHRVYLREDFGIDDALFETLIRGYIKAGRIVLYKSSHYTKLEPWEMNDILVDDLNQLAFKFFGGGTYELWNGVQIGEMGDEWPPIEILNTFEL